MSGYVVPNIISPTIAMVTQSFFKGVQTLSSNTLSIESVKADESLCFPEFVYIHADKACNIHIINNIYIEDLI